MTTPYVVVVRATVDAPDRARVDYLAADNRWSCDAHPRAGDCTHIQLLREHVATALLKPARKDTR